MTTSIDIERTNNKKRKTASSDLQNNDNASSLRNAAETTTTTTTDNDEYNNECNSESKSTNASSAVVDVNVNSSSVEKNAPEINKEELEYDNNKYENSQKSGTQFDDIRHVVVTNDGNPKNLVRLVGLKNLFAKQLPKMPKDYIVRLVFDRRHKSLAILSNDPAVKGTDDEIIGGICYRAYPDMRFSEIAFCAVNQNQQVKVSCEVV